MSPNQYAKAADRQSKREAREYIDSATSQDEDGSLPRPDRDACETYGIFFDAVSATTRLYHQTWMDNGVIVEFVMLHFIQIGTSDDDWYQLARADCAHARAHIHLDDQGLSSPVTEPIRVLHTAEDVQEAYNDSYSAIFDGWQKRERSYQDACRAHPKRRRPTGHLPQGDLSGTCEG